MPFIPKQLEPFLIAELTAMSTSKEDNATARIQKLAAAIDAAVINFLNTHLPLVIDVYFTTVAAKRLKDDAGPIAPTHTYV